MQTLKLTKKYETFPKYKDSGVEWLGTVPKDWSIDNIQHLFAKVKRLGFADEELLSVYRDRGVIIKSSRDDNHNKVSEDLSLYQLVNKGDLAINKMKAWQGSIAVSEYKGIVSPAYFICKPLTKNNSRFMHYLLRSDVYIKQYEKNSGGVRNDQWDLNYERFRKLEIAIPEITEQTMIAEYLDKKIVLIDKIVEKKERQIELLKEKRTLFINDSVNNIKGFAEKLKYIAPEKNIKTESPLSGVVYLGMENIESGTGKYTPSFENLFPESITNIFHKNDVLFGKLRPYLAKVYSPEFDGVCSGEFLILKPKNKKISSRFLFYKLISRDFIKKVDDSTYGTKMPRANWQFIGNQILTYPPLEDQNKIVAKLDTKTKLYEDVINKVSTSIEILKEFKISLISSAVTGKIKV
jgi:type I restriction enzyme S subunit